MRWLRTSSLLGYPGAVADVFRLAAWVVGLIFLIGLLWAATEVEIAREERSERELAIRQAASLADVYAVQLEDLVAQTDRLALAIAYDWQEAPMRFDLRRDHIRGLFPREHGFHVTVIDASGQQVGSSAPVSIPVNWSGTDFFVRHANSCCEGLLISQPAAAVAAEGPMLSFSRRIQRPDGSFAGMVVISAMPDFMVTLQGNHQQTSDSFVTARLAEGITLATRIGNRLSEAPLFRGAAPAFGPEPGARLVPGDQFVDGLGRYVAWQGVGTYPLTAVVGMSEKVALAGYRVVAHGYRLGASIGTLFLFLLALGGIAISVRVARGHRADEEIRSTYRMATDAANEGFYMLSPIVADCGELRDVLIRDCNDRAAALLGLTRAQLIGRRGRDVMPFWARSEVLAICSKALAQGMCEDEMRVPAYGGIRAAWLARRAVHSGSGIALTLTDISDLKAHQQVLADMANHDELTGLPNRRWLTAFLPEAIQRCASRQHRLAVLFIDLDEFKIVNDTLGHEAGDVLLQQVALRIRSAVGPNDRVARLGGDEFTVVLERIGADASVLQIASAINERLAEPFPATTLIQSRVTASIGISLFPEHGQDADSLLKHADVAMYAAKAAGRSCHCLYHPSLSAVLMQRLDEEQALRQAIERREFVVHYQPRVSAITGRLSSVEALVRWQHPKRGLLSPSEFIDMAEEVGLIVPISEFVIVQVGEQLAQWRAQGMPMIPVSVNVSPRQLSLGNTSACLAAVLRRHELAASLLEVEITESAVVDHGASTSRELDAIRALGIRLMIDDFGTGYSSLAQLLRLDVDVLKVDQAFTRSLAQTAEGELLYRAIVSMAAALDMCVVAEGVETLDQLRVLQAIGCDEIQGFIISPAVPPAAIARMASADCLYAFGGPPARALPKALR